MVRVELTAGQVKKALDLVSAYNARRKLDIVITNILAIEDFLNEPVVTEQQRALLEEHRNRLLDDVPNIIESLERELTDYAKGALIPLKDYMRYLRDRHDTAMIDIDEMRKLSADVRIDYWSRFQLAEGVSDSLSFNKFKLGTMASDKSNPIDFRIAIVRILLAIEADERERIKSIIAEKRHSEGVNLSLNRLVACSVKTEFTFIEDIVNDGSFPREFRYELQGRARALGEKYPAKLEESHSEDLLRIIRSDITAAEREVLLAAHIKRDKQAFSNNLGTQIPVVIESEESDRMTNSAS